MHRRDPAAAARRRRRISAGSRKRTSTKSGAPQGQARAKLLRIGAAVAFGAMPNARLSASLRSLSDDGATEDQPQLLGHRPADAGGH
jgi:hypothetical protein